MFSQSHAAMIYMYKSGCDLQVANDVRRSIATRAGRKMTVVTLDNGAVSCKWTTVVTVDLPRPGAHLTLYKIHAHPPSRMCSLEGRELLFCSTHCA